jgi:hypothetical protein
MGNITMPEVEQATHLGIIRTTMKHNIQTNVDENPHIKFLVGCFALFVVSSNVDCYTCFWL